MPGYSVKWLAAALLLPMAAMAQPVRVAIAGLNHGHVSGFLRAAQKRPEVQLVAVYDPDAALLARYAKDYNFSSAMLYTDLGKMLDTVKPDGGWGTADDLGKMNEAGGKPSIMIPYNGLLIVFATPEIHRTVAAGLVEMNK